MHHLATRPPETEFDRGLRRFSLLMLRTVVFLVLFVLVVNVALKHNPFERAFRNLGNGVGCLWSTADSRAQEAPRDTCHLL